MLRQFRNFQRAEEYADEHMVAEDPSEENEDKIAENESQTDSFCNGLWTKTETEEGKHQHILT